MTFHQTYFDYLEVVMGYIHWTEWTLGAMLCVFNDFNAENIMKGRKNHKQFQ
jgi:hypothetical protein